MSKEAYFFEYICWQYSIFFYSKDKPASCETRYVNRAPAPWPLCNKTVVSDSSCLRGFKKKSFGRISEYKGQGIKMKPTLKHHHNPTPFHHRRQSTISFLIIQHFYKRIRQSGKSHLKDCFGEREFHIYLEHFPKNEIIK